MKCQHNLALCHSEELATRNLNVTLRFFVAPLLRMTSMKVVLDSLRLIYNNLDLEEGSENMEHIRILESKERW